jgi:hypothetical protein
MGSMRVWTSGGSTFAKVESRRAAVYKSVIGGLLKPLMTWTIP